MEKSSISPAEIERQKQLVFGPQPHVSLVAPCKTGDGVVHFLQVQVDNLIAKYEQASIKTTFFVPASGSGSRMFQFLHEFLASPSEENRSQVERFLNNIESFAFFQALPKEIRKKLRAHNVNLDEFVQFLLGEHGMGFGNISKGLVPFHKNGPFILNPFQEHILQGKRVHDEAVEFHFTIRENQASTIYQGIEHAESLTGNLSKVHFSTQDPRTNALAFDANHEPVALENGEWLTRPAGHGALLSNLQAVDSDLIFIKNIDNVQHYSKTSAAIQTWKYLGGIALWLQEEVHALLDQPNVERLRELNRQFQLFPEESLRSITANDIPALLDRPIRICGMVRNEGQPGGGPFWVEQDGVISKQIIEKAQISMNGDQFKLMVQSTYFNPVMIAAITKDRFGTTYPLTKFRDDSKYFVVKKKQQGKDIYFAELPGLWNGSMAHWNTVFVEVPSSTFSPVKTVLDLLDEAHND